MFYLDTSAIVLILVREPNCEVLEEFLERSGRALVSSELTLVEVRRAALRRSPETDRLAVEFMRNFDLIPISRGVIERAASLFPRSLRSLDAIHVATALETPGTATLITYDSRMQEAARLAGLTVAAPGRPG